MNNSIPTMAEYFRIGLELDLLAQKDAQDWATSMIEKLDVPPIEIIEVAWGHGLAKTVSNLKEISGGSDRMMAAGWLFGILCKSVADDNSNLGVIASQAMRIAQMANLCEEVCSRFDWIDDHISLAVSNTFGTLDECAKDLINALHQYSVFPLFITDSNK